LKSLIAKYFETTDFALATEVLASIFACEILVVNKLAPRRTYLKEQTVKTGHPRAEPIRRLVLRATDRSRVQVGAKG
jgi:hypothetical protein